MLTGDEARTANFIAEEIGIDDVRSNLLPQDKASIIKELQNIMEVSLWLEMGSMTHPL